MLSEPLGDPSCLSDYRIVKSTILAWTKQPITLVNRCIVADRNTDYLLPQSVDDWLNEDHLARFVVEVSDGLDISNLTRQYAGRGSKAHHPATLLAILVYGYASGVFSSRRLEQATYDSVAFRYIAAGTHPDHDTLANFRRRFLDELAGLFVQVMELAREMKLLKLGTVCLYGTKIHANASRHSALSYGHIQKLEVNLKAEVQVMAHKLRTKAGRAIYALREQTVEPVFGIIKSVMGFRQFSLRGLKRAGAEWTLVCLAWNVKRMAVLRQKCVASG
jgi:transposase